MVPILPPFGGAYNSLLYTIQPRQLSFVPSGCFCVSLVASPIHATTAPLITRTRSIGRYRPQHQDPKRHFQGLATPPPNTDISNLQIPSQPYPSNLFSPLFHPSVHSTRHLETFSCHLSFIKDVSFSPLTQLPTPICPIIHHVHPTSQLHASPHLGPKPAT